MNDIGIKLSAKDDTSGAFNSVRGKLSGLKKEADSIGGTIGGLVGQFNALGVAIGGALTVGAFKAAIDTADEFSKMAQKTGVAVEALRQLDYAASLSDVSTEALGTGLRKLSVNMAAAAGGSKEQAAIFKAMGLSVKDAAGNLKGADAMLSEVAAQFANFKDGPEKAALAVQLFGKAGADMIPLLNAGASGLKTMAEEATALGTVFSADFAKNAEAFNDNLTRIGTGAKSASYALASELLPTLNTLAEAFVEAQKNSSGFGSYIGGALKTIIEAASILYADVSFVLQGIGREFGAIGAQLVALSKGDFKGFTAISEAVKADGIRARAELDKFQYDLLNAGYLTSKAGAGRGTATDPRLLGSTQTSAPIVGTADTAAAKKAISDANRELAEQAKLISELSGLTGSFSADWERLSAIYAKGAISLDQLTQYQADLLAKQPAIVKQTKDQADAQKDLAKIFEETTKELDKYAESQRKLITAGDEELAKAQAAFDAHGKLASVLQEEALARLENARIITAMAGEDTVVVDAQIKAKKELIKILRAGEVREAAKTAAEEWQKTADTIRDSLTDAFMAAIDGTKSLWVSLRDSVVGMFKNMVLRPVIQGMMTPIAGALTGSLMGTAANAATGTAATGGLLGTFGGGFAWSSFALGMEGTIAAISEQGFIAGFGNAMTSASSLARAGSFTGALGAAMPYIGAAMAAVAVLNSIGGKFTSAANTGDINRSYGSNGSTIYSNSTALESVQATSFVDTIQAAYTTAAKALGVNLAQTGYWYSSNSGREGANPNFSLGASINGVQTYQSATSDPSLYGATEVARTDANLQLEASRAVFAALKSSELPGYLAKVFDQITVGTASQADIDGALAYAGSLKAIRSALLETRTPLQILQDNVDTAFGTLATSASTFKADFVSAIDAGITPESLAQWQALGVNMDALTTATTAASTAVSKATVTAVDMAKAVDSAGTSVKDSTQALYDYGQGLLDTIKAIRVEATANLATAKDSVIASLQALSQANTTAQAAKTAAASGVQAALQTLNSANNTAQTNLHNALQGVVNTIAQAAKDVSAAESTMHAALGAITSGYVNAVKTRDGIKDEITAAYVASTTKVTDAQTALTNAQLSAADKIRATANTLKQTANDLMGTLTDLAGTSAGSGNLTQQYTAQRSAFEAIAAKALTGDATAIGQLGGAGKSYVSASNNASGTFAQYQSDDMRVRQVLAQVMQTYGGALTPDPVNAATDPVAVAQAALTIALGEQSDALALVTSSGAGLVLSNTTLADKLATASTAVEQWAAAVTATGASTTQSATLEIDGLVTTANNAIQGWQDLVDAQGTLLASASQFDLTGLASVVSSYQDSITTAIEAQTTATTALADLSTALTQAAAVGITLDATKTSAEAFAQALATLTTATAGADTALANLQAATTQAGALSIALAATVTDTAAFTAALGNYTTALSDYDAVQGDQLIAVNTLVNRFTIASNALDAFSQATSGIDFSPLAQLNPLGDLLTTYADAVLTLQTATNAYNQTPQGQVAGLYQSILGRNMEAGVFDQYYAPLLAAGATMQDISTSMTALAGTLGWANMTADAKVTWLMQNAQGAGITYSADYFRSLLIDGSHAGGLANVPFDGYTASLHSGERVLTAQDNQVFNNIDWSSFGKTDAALIDEIKALRQEVTALRQETQATAGHTAKTARILDRVTLGGESLQTTVV